MDASEADRLVKLMTGLFPQDVTLERASHLMKRFQLYDASVVEEEIKREHDNYPALTPSRLLGRIQDRSTPISSFYLESKQQRQSKAIEEQLINATIGPLRDEQLEQYKSRALAKLPERSRSLLSKSDPRHSPFMRSLIYRELSTSRKT
jgi:hypothetical protein